MAGKDVRIILAESQRRGTPPGTPPIPADLSAGVQLSWSCAAWNNGMLAVDGPGSTSDVQSLGGR